ncbi:MAG: TrkA C-terminal domain-containing protein [Oscillospiraceae bacterium]
MTETAAPAQYLQIALDIATRIAAGEFAEGSRIYGRSVMSSEYSVSPETIRRALMRLSDMKVVTIKPQSGAAVLSADSARRYIQRYGEQNDVQALRTQLKDLMGQYVDLNRRLLEVSSALCSSRDTFSAAATEPFPNYEITIPADSWIIGKSIGGLRFWQATGGTVVGIRRGQHVLLSPGPFVELYPGDVIVLVGSPTAVEAARDFVKEGGCHDSI